MRKSILALCVAAALTAPMIAQADANLLMAQPALFFQFEVDQAQPVTLIAEVPAATDNRLPGPQLEAAAIASKSSQARSWPDGNGIDSHEDYGAKPVSGPFEVGWRSS